jgi:hypothetical protein
LQGSFIFLRTKRARRQSKHPRPPL